MKRHLAFIALLALGGCGFTPQGDFIRSAVKEYGAQAYDEGLDNAVYFMCYPASHGSVERKFGTSKELANAYNVICGRVGNTTLTPQQDSADVISVPTS